MTVRLAALVLVIGAASVAVGDHFRVAGLRDPGSESAQALRAMRGALGYDPEPGLVASVTGPYRPADVEALADRLRRDPAVGAVETAFGDDPQTFLRAGAERTLLAVHFRSSDPDTLKAPVERLSERASVPGARVDAGGYAVGFLDVNRIARADLVRAEAVAIPLLALLLVGMLGRRAVAPVAIGGVALLATTAILRALASVTDISIFALNLSVFLALGLATDYGLLLLAGGRAARRTIAFSGTVVAGGFAGLLVFPQNFLVSMGVGGIVAAAVAAGSALALAPRAGRLDLAGGPRWERWSAFVLRRRVPVAVATAALLTALGAAALGLTTTFPDYRDIPRGEPTRTVGETIARHYSPQLEYPVNVLGPVAPDVPGALGSRRLGDRTSQLLLAQPPTAPESRALVRRLRRSGAQVGGRTAEFIDLGDSIAARAPVAVAVAGAATFLALLAMTGSVLIALKAFAFNLFGILATLGLLTVLFGGSLDLTAAVVIVATTFGLAMDYSVLLLARIVAEHRAGHPDAAAIARGMRATGPIVTRAALLLAVPLLALASSRLELVRQIGVGAAIGVAVDATVIRMALVPAVMGMLGAANWWPASRRRRPRPAPP